MRPNDYFYFLTSLVPDIWQANLEIKIAALETQIEETKAKLDDAAAKLKNPDPHQTVSNHIKLLRQYNDIRDIGTSLMGVIANNRQVPMKRVYQDFHVDEKD
ncbi:MAG: hypothetical protein L6R38_003332 [Xanthoria sp. 2 TBL-2021]|nr:MAG: hypothetical protein L6R38_003332 [Xanthoria sp. 2 TBL-2021]